MLFTDNSSRDVSNCDSSNGRVEMELGLRPPQQEVEQMCENVFFKNVLQKTRLDNSQSEAAQSRD